MSTALSQTHTSGEPWSGDLNIKPRKFALYVGPAANTEPHAMHVFQLFILLDGEMRLRLWEECRFPLRGEFILEGETIIELVPGRPLLVPPDYPLQLEGGGNIAIYFLNPELAEGEDETPTHQLRCGLMMLLPEAVSDIVARLERCLREKYSREEVSLLCARMAELISMLGERESLYWLVRRTLKCLFEAFENDEDGSIKTICECVAESGEPPNEFHVQREFRKQVGVAIRRFSIALRLWDAVEEMAYRKNLDDVTAAVNLAKGMLSRYFKRVIGISPSAFHHKGSVLVLN